MFGIDDIVSTGLKILDRVLPDQKSKDEAKLKLLELQQQGQLKIAEFGLEQAKLDTQVMQGQAEINKIDAGSNDNFQRRWRPFIGWCGGICVALYYIPQTLLANYIWLKHFLDTGTVAEFPMDAKELIGLVVAMLGVGVLRTVDKFKK